ncbi:outer membrane protein TolC [Roseivirga ehrenbergii]|uniref:TolC family protein n=1 Tax=Roseivirga ehrenbergii (strain DSM 102268 / JCM 13514 / KCTC 12282 / NCIMB 14502 / KMM 6017) TaxID=279360 RepID=UPI0007868B37|nr:TolC family protein [Roseivirga ehrenbergii]TCL07830.1 outer membrane protein TolC [Roseivirga ehrenbergii]
MKKLLYTLFLTVFLITSVKAQRVLTLDECIQIALNNNLDIKRSRNNAIAAKANYDQSKMNFLPSLNAGASHNWNEGLQFDNTSGSLVNTTTLSGSGYLSSSLTLFNGFSNVLGMQRDKILYDASEETIKSNIQSVEASIVSSFLQVVTNEENLKIAEQTRELLNEQLEREEKREKAGVGNMEQVYNFRSQVAQQDLNIVNLKNSLESNKLLLIQLLLLDPLEDYEFEGISVDDTELESALGEYDGIFEKSMTFSPSVKAAKLSLDASEKNFKIARNSWMPSLSVSASYGTGWSSNVKLRDENNNLILPVQVLDVGTQFDRNRSKSAGLSLNIPLFNRFQNRNQIQQSKIQVLNSEIGLTQAKNNLTNLIQQAYLNLANAKSSYAAAKESMINLDMAFEFAKSRYENGTIDFVTYLQSLNGKNRGELQLVQAKYTILFRQLILDIYTGEMNNQN